VAKYYEMAVAHRRGVDQGPRRGTSPQPSPRIRRGYQKVPLCQGVSHLNRENYLRFRVRRDSRFLRGKFSTRAIADFLSLSGERIKGEGPWRAGLFFQRRASKFSCLAGKTSARRQGPSPGAEKCAGLSPPGEASERENRHALSGGESYAPKGGKLMGDCKDARPITKKAPR
jgi:hypothetical protein